MQLSDFADMAFNVTYIYVFDDEDSLDSFCTGGNDYELLFTLRSNYRAEVYLKPKYSMAEVLMFKAIRGNVAVLIKPNVEEK